MGAFADYITEQEQLEQQQLEEARVSVKGITGRMYKLQDELQKLDQQLMDYDDKADEDPQKFPRLRNYKKFNTTLEAFKRELEAAKTQLRKGER